MVVLTCRRLAKNTAINLILDWTADAIVFPLMAIRWRMEAQGRLVLDLQIFFKGLLNFGIDQHA